MLRLLLKVLNEQMEYEWIQGNSPCHQRSGQIEDIEFYKLLLVFVEPPSYQCHCQVRITDEMQMSLTFYFSKGWLR